MEKEFCCVHYNQQAKKIAFKIYFKNLKIPLKIPAIFNAIITGLSIHPFNLGYLCKKNPYDGEKFFNTNLTEYPG